LSKFGFKKRVQPCLITAEIDIQDAIADPHRQYHYARPVHPWGESVNYRWSLTLTFGEFL